MGGRLIHHPCTWKEHQAEEPDSEHELVHGQQDGGVLQRALHFEEVKEDVGSAVCLCECVYAYMA